MSHVSRHYWLLLAHGRMGTCRYQPGVPGGLPLVCLELLRKAGGRGALLHVHISEYSTRRLPCAQSRSLARSLLSPCAHAMAFEGVLLCPRVCVPYFDRVVVRDTDELAVMHHHAHHPVQSSDIEGVFACSQVHVPVFHALVVLGLLEPLRSFSPCITRQNTEAYHHATPCITRQTLARPALGHRALVRPRYPRGLRHRLAGGSNKNRGVSSSPGESNGN
jgi:hypothetical protein